jgi:hypothetical protein
MAGRASEAPEDSPGLFLADAPAEHVSPFDQLPIPEKASFAAVAGAAAFDAAAPVEPAAAVPAGATFIAFEGLRVLPAILSGSGAPMVGDLLIVR